jgi:drug/metabolite transporter (DMT)-like permease
LSLKLRSDLLLLLAAAIWGFAFVAQRIGMEHTGPLTFNGVRFALGAAALVPLIWWRRRLAERTRCAGTSGTAKRGGRDDENGGAVSTSCAGATGATGGASAGATRATSGSMLPDQLRRGLVLGLVLCGGATLQQTGLVYTTAGKAGFITGLYVVLVPLLGLGLGARTRGATWLGAVLATGGLYLLSVTGRLHMELGDLLVLGSALFWAVHVLLIGRWAPGTDPVQLACLQFVVCSALSLAGAFVFEDPAWSQLRDALWPILYAGLMSTGVAYTLQVVAQRHAPPAHAAIILSLESVFAVLGGGTILGERLALRGWVGCALMLAGMILSQLGPTDRRPTVPAPRGDQTDP